MTARKLEKEMVQEFLNHAIAEELADGTIQKYRRDIASFMSWVGEETITKEVVTNWKEHLVSRGYAPATINSMLAAINMLFKHMGWLDCTVKFLKIQRKMFRDQSKELTQEEFRSLVHAAEQTGKRRLAMLLETIASTGIRASEVKYVTVEAAQRGQTEIAMKGKIRTILLPSKLCRKLLKYAKKNKIASGEIFLTRSGKGLSRKQIWAEMKRLCSVAGIDSSKVFPHNLRHLFATAFYRLTKDIAKLADVLGHSNVETTRIYLLTTSTEHVRQLDRLCFIS